MIEVILKIIVRKKLCISRKIFRKKISSGKRKNDS